MIDNEVDIIQRTKYLYANSKYSLPLKKCIGQAMTELCNIKELSSIYNIFDITKNDLENYLLDKYFNKENLNEN